MFTYSVEYVRNIQLKVLLLSVEKTFSYVFYHYFFMIMLENSAPPSLNFSSPMTNSSKEISSNVAPSPQPKILLKTSVHFPITITVCKDWSKFVTCSPSPRNRGGVRHPQRHSYYRFRLCRTKWLYQNFDPLTLGKK